LIFAPSTKDDGCIPLMENEKLFAGLKFINPIWAATSPSKTAAHL
jgi:hypothetical protein